MVYAPSCHDRSASVSCRPLPQLRPVVILLSIILMCSKATAKPADKIGEFGEDGNSPHWDPISKILYFVGVNPGMAFEYNPDTNEHFEAQIENFFPEVNFIVPIIGNKFHFAISIGQYVGIFSWDLSQRNPTMKLLGKISVGESTDDYIISGKADAKGRLWLGSKFGSVFSVDAVGVVTKRLSRVGQPRGLAWSTYDTKFYYADSSKRVIVESNFNVDTAEVSSDGEVIFDFASKNVTGTPKGITVDASSNLWVACSSTNNILKIDLKTKNISASIAIPEANNIISIAFGDVNLDSIYVTTSGQIFRVTDTGSTGLPGRPFDFMAI